MNQPTAAASDMRHTGRNPQEMAICGAILTVEKRVLSPQKLLTSQGSSTTARKGIHPLHDGEAPSRQTAASFDPSEQSDLINQNGAIALRESDEDSHVDELEEPILENAALRAAQIKPGVSQKVTAILVTRGVTPYLAGALKSIADQRVRPARLVIADVSGSGSIDPSDLEAAGIACTVISAPKAKNFGQAVGKAVADAQVLRQWLWLMHDDSAAHETALGFQLRPVEYGSSVSIVGAKQVKLGKREELISVGYTSAVGGRRFTGIENQEFDQGQHDGNEDVYAVSLNGALVSLALWHELKGTDPAFGKWGDSIEFCRRARLAGHRVVVVPDAVVEHAQATLMDVRDSTDLVETPSPDVLDDELEGKTFWNRLKSTAYFWATNIPVLAFPFLVLGMLLAAPLRALYRILNKSPRRALAELAAPFWLLSKTFSVLRSRSRLRKTKAVPTRVVNQLLATGRDHMAQNRDERLARSALRKKLYGPTELDRREMRARATARRGGLTALGLLLVAATLYGLRDVLGSLYNGSRIVGGALLPSQGGWAELWQHWTSGWIRDGLGASAPSDPLLSTLGPVMGLTLGNMQAAVNATIVFSLIVSGLGAWFAAGTATRSVTARVWAGLLWAAAPTLLVAVGQGRLGAIIAHSALPWLVVAIARGCGVNRQDERGVLRLRSEQRQEQELLEQNKVEQQNMESVSGSVRPRKSLAAVGGAALVFAVVTAGAPALLLPGIVLIGAAAVYTRTRALVFVPLPALAMLGPVLFRGWVNRGFGGWRVLLSDPGSPFPYDPSRSWQRLLGVPTDIGEVSFASGIWTGVLAALPLVLGGAILLGAVLALLRRPPHAGPIRFMWVVAAIGLAVSFLSSSITVASGDEGPVVGWSGAGLSLMTLGLLGACVLGSEKLVERALAHSFGWRQIVLGVATLLVFAVPVYSLVSWGQSRAIAGEDSPLAALDRAIVPAVAQQMQENGRQARVLAVAPAGAGKVAYQLLHSDGVQLAETSTVVNIAYLGGRPDDIAELVAHVTRGLEQDGAPAAAFRLAELGVGAVLVPPSQGDDSAQLVSRIDTVAGLQRITENETGTVWRVDPTGLDPALAQASEQYLASVTAPGDDSATRTTVVAGEPAWAATYEVDAKGALSKPEMLDASRLAVNTTVESSPVERKIVLAENSAPGWKAVLGSEELVPTQVNGLQAFELPAGTESGDLSISYERSSRLPWMALQSAVLLVFGVLAIPVRRKDAQKWA